MCFLATARGDPDGGQESFEFSFFFPFSLFSETDSHMLLKQMSATLEQKYILRKTHLAFKVLVHHKMILSVFWRQKRFLGNRDRKALVKLLKGETRYLTSLLRCSSFRYCKGQYINNFFFFDIFVTLSVWEGLVFSSILCKTSLKRGDNSL